MNSRNVTVFLAVIALLLGLNLVSGSPPATAEQAAGPVEPQQKSTAGVICHAYDQ